MDANRRGSRIWEWVGKIAALVAIVGGLISAISLLMQWFHPHTPKIEVKGIYYEWPVAETSIKAAWFWRFNVENIGGETAKNVRVEFPFDGKFILDDSSEIKTFNKGSVQIGDFQPSDKKILSVWSSDWSLFNKEQRRDKGNS